jgi:hypothetical protein
LGLRRWSSKCFTAMGFRLGLRLITLGHGTVGGNFVKVLGIFQLHKVGNVKESVALQADVHESRLHSGKDPSHAPL